MITIKSATKEIVKAEDEEDIYTINVVIPMIMANLDVLAMTKIPIDTAIIYI